MQGILFDTEKIKTGIGIVPNCRRPEVGLVYAFDIEMHVVLFSPYLHRALRLIPGMADVLCDLYRQRRIGGSPVKTEGAADDEPVGGGMEFGFAHGQCTSSANFCSRSSPLNPLAI